MLVGTGSHLPFFLNNLKLFSLGFVKNKGASAEDAPPKSWDRAIRHGICRQLFDNTREASGTASVMISDEHDTASFTKYFIPEVVLPSILIMSL